MELINRVCSMLDGEAGTEDMVRLQCLVDSAIARICLRISEEELPTVLEPIAAEIVVKMFRRTRFEGITTELVTADYSQISTTFDKIMDEYEDELARYRYNSEIANGKKRVYFV